MKYDFHSVPDRSNCGSAKWDAIPGASTEMVPLSVADMEFPTAPAIVDALKKMLDTTILGYTQPTDAYYNAVCGWMQRRHNYTVTREQIILTPGVVDGFGLLIEALSKPGEGVIIFNPVYYPFDRVIRDQQRTVVNCPLIKNGLRYEIDFELFDTLAAREDVTLLLFCSPHNPVGRVWTVEELQKIVAICEKHGVFIISDEIHNDLIMPGHTHTVMATVTPNAKNICAVCTAPSKTFNLAGVQCSNIILPENRVDAVLAAVKKPYDMLNVFAYTACRAAYEQCEDWLEELLQVIADNGKYVENFMAENIPQITVIPAEGTYLQWWDCRSLGLELNALEKFMHDAGLWLDEGYIFGAGGEGFERINLACSRVTLEKAMARLLKAVKELNH